MDNNDHRSRRLVLRETVADLAEDEVQRFAEVELGWPRQLEQDENIARAEPREIAWAAGSALSLHYTEDPVSQHCYLRAWGYDKDAVEAVARMAEGRLKIWSLDALLEAIERAPTPTTRGIAVIRAGVGAPDEFDERFFAAISAAMEDPDTRVRETAIYATAFSSYPQYRPVLEQVLRADPDENRREDAWYLLESFDVEGIEGP